MYVCMYVCIAILVGCSVRQKLIVGAYNLPPPPHGFFCHKHTHIRDVVHTLNAHLE